MAWIERYATAKGERRYVVRWRVGGKVRSKVVPAPRKNALKLKAHIETQAALGILYEAPPEKLGDFIDAWLERYERRVKPSSASRRRDALHSLRKQAKLDDAPLPQIRYADVEDSVVALARRAPRQAQIALDTLKLALKEAKRRGQVLDDAIFELDRPRVTEREPVFLTWDEVELVQSFTREDMARLVPIAALTGARLSELLALTNAAVDLAAGEARIMGDVKTSASRRCINLTPTAVKLLREQLLVSGPNAFGLVFPTSYGERWDPNNFRARVFRPAVKNAATDLRRRDPPAAELVRRLTFHDLRHTCVSLMIAAGCSVKVIAEQLGHADGGVLVLRRYGHLYAGAQREAVGVLDAFIRREQAKTTRPE